MTTVITETGPTEIGGAEASGDDLWLPAADLPAATGWSLRDEGFCRGDVCVPLPPRREEELVRGDAVNAAAFWRHLGGPTLHDAAGDVWMLGEPAASRAAALAALQAPDFTLPDLEGKSHALREYRGRKVLLVSWASW